MNLPTNTTSDGAAFAVTTRSSAVAFENVSQGGGIFRQRRCVWCINCTHGCAKTVLAHYHKAVASNLIGETFLTKETGVIEIWEV